MLCVCRHSSCYTSAKNQPSSQALHASTQYRARSSMLLLTSLTTKGCAPARHSHAARTCPEILKVHRSCQNYSQEPSRNLSVSWYRYHHCAAIRCERSNACRQLQASINSQHSTAYSRRQLRRLNCPDPLRLFDVRCGNGPPQSTVCAAAASSGRAGACLEQVDFTQSQCF